MTKSPRPSPPYLHTVSDQILEVGWPGNEANPMHVLTVNNVASAPIADHSYYISRAESYTNLLPDISHVLHAVLMSSNKSHFFMQD